MAGQLHRKSVTKSQSSRLKLRRCRAAGKLYEKNRSYSGPVGVRAVAPGGLSGKCRAGETQSCGQAASQGGGEEAHQTPGNAEASPQDEGIVGFRLKGVFGGRTA